MKPIQSFTHQSMSLVTLPIAQSARIEDRLRAILNKGANRKMPNPRSIAAASALTLAMVTSLATMRPAARAAPPAPSQTVPAVIAQNGVAKLPDGTTVQLVHIIHIGKEQAWGPDGKLIVDHAALIQLIKQTEHTIFGPTADASSENRGMYDYGFFLRFDAMRQDPAHSPTVWGSNEDGSEVFTYPPKRLSQHSWSMMIEVIAKKELPQTMMRLGVPYGSWKTIAVAGPKLGKVRSDTGSEIDFRHMTYNPYPRSTVYPLNPEDYLQVTNVPPAAEYQLVAIAGNGKHYVLHKILQSAYGKKSAGTIEGSLTYPNWKPMHHVKSIELQTRQDQWVEFKNIPLEPLKPVSTH